MAHRTCTVDGCECPHQARGYCGPHYSTWHRRTNGRGDAIFTNTCIQCGRPWETRRSEAKYCSVQCKGDAYRRVSKLPSDHPVIRQIAEVKRAERAARRDAKRSQFEWRTARQCPGCACWFTPLHTPNAVCCSKRCVRRVHRWRRAAAERGARGSFTWSEFMRIARKFDYSCAYCGVKPERLDPDHVVPLSRGGSNAPSNLLPACFMCNSSKCAMTLPEWAAWRAERGQEPRFTSWTPGDPRYVHLTDTLLVAA